MKWSRCPGGWHQGRYLPTSRPYQGDVLAADSIRGTFLGVDAVICCLGPDSNFSPGKLMSAGLANIVAGAEAGGGEKPGHDERHHPEYRRRAIRVQPVGGAFLSPDFPGGSGRQAGGGEHRAGQRAAVGHRASGRTEGRAAQGLVHRRSRCQGRSPAPAAFCGLRRLSPPGNVGTILGESDRQRRSINLPLRDAGLASTLEAAKDRFLTWGYRVAAAKAL